MLLRALSSFPACGTGPLLQDQHQEEEQAAFIARLNLQPRLSYFHTINPSGLHSPFCSGHQRVLGLLHSFFHP